MKKTLLVIMTLLLLSACSSSFPLKKQISAMANEEAEKLLVGKTAQEIKENWGGTGQYAFWVLR